jgi:FdhD protein
LPKKTDTESLKTLFVNNITSKQDENSPQIRKNLLQLPIGKNMKNSISPAPYRLYQNDTVKKIRAHLITETPVSLTVNGKNWLTFMCTPTRLEALAVGFLFNEGVIQDYAEIGALHLCERGDNVDIWLHHAAEKPQKWTHTSGCAGGMTSLEPRVDLEPARRLPDFSLSPKRISVLLNLLDENQSLYRQTGGVHTSVLSDGEKSLIAAEDIGRHNTLDKIAGVALMENIRPEKRILLTTGRISSEMMQKAYKIGATFVISRTSPSSLSFELAEKYGITLIGYAKKHRFNVYTHGERIS